MAPTDRQGWPPGWGRLAAGTARIPTVWVAAAALVAWAVSAAYMIRFGASWHLDLRVYRAAGHSLFHGGSPYTETFTVSRLPFTYTPFALFVLSPLSLADLGLVEWIWWALSAFCLVAAARLMLDAAFAVAARRAWALAALLGGVATLALEPVRSNFDYGQINVVLMVMVVADLTAVRGRWRGVLVGLAAAIKLTPLVYLVAFAAGRDWRSLLRGIATFVGVTAVSWAVIPSDSARYWFHEFFDAKRTGALGIGSNQSWNGMVHRAPFDGSHVGTVVWLVLSLATLACGIMLTRRLVVSGRSAEVVMVLALTEVLVSPVSWSHHWSWLALAPIVAASVSRVHRSVATALMALVGLGVAAPYLWGVPGVVGDLTSNALVLGAAVVLVLWLVAEARSRGPAPRRRTAPSAHAEPSADPAH